MTTFLKEWREQIGRAESFYEVHKQDIEAELARERAQEILDRMPDILRGPHQVWCRNSDVCEKATPCGQLTCFYKFGDRRDIHVVADGTSKCQQFQVTCLTDDWSNARLIANFASVNLHDDCDARS